MNDDDTMPPKPRTLWWLLVAKLRMIRNRLADAWAVLVGEKIAVNPNPEQVPSPPPPRFR